MITQSRLRELFDYDASTGCLIRRIPVRGFTIGSAIGTVKPKGYVVAVVDGKPYRVHHLIWVYHKGYFADELDHINRIRSDNRIENLRECSHSQNLGNSRARVHKYKGVTFCKYTNKWRAQLNGHLGRFNTIEDAALAYNKAAEIHYGEFANLNKVESC